MSKGKGKGGWVFSNFVEDGPCIYRSDEPSTLTFDVAREMMLDALADIIAGAVNEMRELIDYPTEEKWLARPANQPRANTTQPNPLLIDRDKVRGEE